MSANEKIRITAHDLMELHVEALFTHDRNMRLRTINEPWPGETPAPQFFLGRTVEGTTVCRFRYDLPEQLVEQMKLLCADEPLVTDFRTKPKHLTSYMRLLQGERFTMGPCFLIPREAEPTMQVVSVTRENMLNYLHGGFEWLISEIDYAQPCIALVIGNRAVSICRSVRITSRAHEAGLETLETFRGRGYAAEVVAGWAKAVREVGAIPLYSTFWENSASQSVARKLALNFYGVNFTIL
ncbi:kasugamycin N-acetyltransferase AAC(2')-IIb [Paenibacillus contaminans]|nr:kasugamycin N-acetyltransferase AAC(2')-IIb [Paenibacillus contaminans]